MSSTTFQPRGRILVTGASGFLGRRIVQLLASRGYQVRAFVRSTSQTKPLTAVSAELVVGDIANPGSLEPAFDGIDFVVHAAADTAGTEAGGRTVTIGGTRSVITLCRQFAVRKLIYISSCSVYQVAGLPPQHLINEQASLEIAPHERGPYSWAKLEAEGLIRDFMASDSTSVVCLRPGAVYGPGGDPFPPKLGFSWRHRLFLVIGMGQMVLPLVHVDNVADGVLHALQSSNANGKVFNVIDPEKITKRQYNDQLVRRLFAGASFVYIPQWILYSAVTIQELLFKLIRRRPLLSRYRLASSQTPVFFDGSKIIRDLDWKPPISFQQAVEEVESQPLQSVRGS